MPGRIARVFVLLGAAVFASVALAMSTPPPEDKGLQRVIIEVPIMEVSGPPLPQVEVGAPLSMSWIFDSDQPGGDWGRIWAFSMNFAGRRYTQDDVIEAGMIVWRDSWGITAEIVLADAMHSTPLRITAFEEYWDSNLWLDFGNGTVARTGVGGRYEPLSEVPEPAGLALVIAALLALRVATARKPTARAGPPTATAP